MTRSFIVLFLGKRGSGKTTLLTSCLPYLPRPVFILDTMDEFNEGLTFLDELHLRNFIAYGGKNNSGVYVLKTTSDEDTSAFFQLIVDMEAACTIVVDEVSKVASPNKLDANLNRIIQYGRHWNTSVVAAARRAHEVDPNLRAQCDCIVSFKQTEKRDVDQLRSFSDDAGKVADLDFDKHQFLVMGDYEFLPFASVLDRSKSDPTPSVPVRRFRRPELGE